MQWCDIQFSPRQRTLRQFAALWLVFLAVPAAMQYLAGNAMIALVLAGVSLFVGMLGLLKPALLRPLYVGAMLLTFPIGWTTSRILLAVLYFGVFTPVAVLFRLIGRDVLRRRRLAGKQTYWMPRAGSETVESYLGPY